MDPSVLLEPIIAVLIGRYCGTSEDDDDPADIVLNLAAVSFINSSNVARLLRLRKQAMAANRRLLLCGVNTQVWGIFLVTGLDKIFGFTNDISTALATLQMKESQQTER